MKRPKAHLDSVEHVLSVAVGLLHLKLLYRCPEVDLLNHLQKNGRRPHKIWPARSAVEGHTRKLISKEWPFKNCMRKCPGVTKIENKTSNEGPQDVKKARVGNVEQPSSSNTVPPVVSAMMTCLTCLVQPWFNANVQPASSSNPHSSRRCGRNCMEMREQASTGINAEWIWLTPPPALNQILFASHGTPSTLMSQMACTWDWPSRANAKEWSGYHVLFTWRLKTVKGAEVKWHLLNPEQKQQFEKAKQAEVSQWLVTAAVRKAIGPIPAGRAVQMRWVLTWKDMDLPRAE